MNFQNKENCLQNSSRKTFKNHFKYSLSLIGLILFGTIAFAGNASAATEFISTIE